MSDANRAEQDTTGAGSSSNSTDASQRPDFAVSADDQPTAAVGPKPAKPRLSAPTPAWPPVPTAGNPGGGNGGGTKGSSQNSDGSQQSPLDRVTAAASRTSATQPNHVVAAAHVDTHAVLQPRPKTPREKFQFSEAVNRAREAVASAAGRGPRRARLQLKKIDPWSVMKFSFAVAFVLFVMGVVASAILSTVLDAMGIFDSLNETIRSLTTSDESTGASFEIDAKFVIGGSALLGAVNMVLFTAMSTLGAFIYNVCADLAGGVELTLAERE